MPLALLPVTKLSLLINVRKTYKREFLAFISSIEGRTINKSAGRANVIAKPEISTANFWPSKGLRFKLQFSTLALFDLYN
jgi:hypothetical protein